MPFPYELIDTLCRDVGIDRVRQLPPLCDGLIDPPEGSALWRSGYAQVMLWPTVAAEFKTAVLNGQSWLDESLRASETRDRPVDGYLIIALQEEPTGDDGVRAVRQIELSTRICRKHVIWPCTRSLMGWKGLAAVSVLGFFEIETSNSMQALPNLDPEARALWDRIERGGHNQAAEEDRVEVAQ